MKILIIWLIFLSLTIQIRLEGLEQFYHCYFVAALGYTDTVAHLNSHYITSPYYIYIKIRLKPLFIFSF